MRSTSIYSHDLGHNIELEQYAGHIENSSIGENGLNGENPTFIKTHSLPIDKSPAIYVVRDGRESCASLWEFYDRSITLKHIVCGMHQFGTWSEHLATWKPWIRRHTLLLRYEEMVNDLESVLNKLSHFLGLRVLTNRLPSRSSIAKLDGRWVRYPSDWRTKFSKEDLELFWKTNGQMMEMLGYGEAGKKSEARSDISSR